MKVKSKGAKKKREYKKDKRIPKPDNFQPEEFFTAGHRWAGQKRCQAWNGNAGRQCLRQAMKNIRVCGTHGGRSLQGLGHQTITDFRHSKSLPAKMLGDYERHRNDPDILNLADEIALVDTRLGELLKRVQVREAGALWIKARAEFIAMSAGIDAGDADAASIAKDRLDDVLREGQADYFVWSDIVELTEKRRRLVETERRRQIDMRLYMSAEQAWALLGAVVAIIRENVTDKKVLSRISRSINNLLGAGAFNR